MLTFRISLVTKSTHECALLTEGSKETAREMPAVRASQWTLNKQLFLCFRPGCEIHIKHVLSIIGNIHFTYIYHFRNNIYK